MISAALAVSMAVSMMPATAVSAFAAGTSTNTAETTTVTGKNSTESEAETSGYCGAENQEESVQWKYDESTKVLTIFGNGPMADYEGIADTDVGTDNDLRPWKPYLNQITEVHIEEGVTAIGNSAFRGMKALKKANIPASIQHLGDYIFRYDEALEEVIWAEGFEAAETTDVDSNQNVYTGKYLPTSMFDFCSELGKDKELTEWLPKSFEGVGCAAVRGTQFTVDFDNWSNLKYIGAYAFSMMRNLESFTVTDDIEFGLRKNPQVPDGTSNALQGSGLKKMIVRTEKLPYAIVRGCEKLSVIDLGSNPTIIGDSEFAGTAIEKIDIPKSVTKVDAWAFANCQNLKRVTFYGETALHHVPFPACGIETFIIEEGAKITSDDSNPFREQPTGSYPAVTSLKNVEILGTLNTSRTDMTTETLWKNMFSPSEQLKEVTVSDANLQYVKAETFPKMENLKVVGDDATFEASLAGCTNLKTVDLTGCKKIASYAAGCFGDGMNDSTVIYVNDASAIPGSDTGISNRHGIVMVVKGGTVNTDKTGFDSVTKAGCTAKWYEDANCQIETKDTTPVTGKTYYAKWKVIPVAATMTATTSKSAYLVNTPVDVNITVNPGTYGAEIHKGKVALTYGDEVEKVELDGKELTEKEYTVQELAQMMKLTSRSSNIKATLNVTYKKVGKFDFNVALKDANGAQICADGTQVVVAEKAAELTPATELYTLTVKNADVTIKNGDEEIKAEKNDKGELIAKVPEKADVTVTYTSQSDAVAFDQWTITTDETLDVDVKNNPLKFQMPAGGVTIEAMTKDASIEEDEPNILGTAAVVGTAAAGTAILAWQGYQLGTELYLKTALPAGTAIPTNRAELALLVWNHAGKPAPAAVLPADATDTQKAIAWAVENDLLKAAKDNGETYVDTDSVSRVEVIRVWNKAQEK
ncbi:leucine-rich repeat domain-containing protein [Faecalibacterium sp. DFI.5.82]|uniref:leucine-rich repeat domain-containing protein n=1 Tax=Faecalibacterium sp. DFI.5.82 TaxID=3031725 RepID=UPI0023AFBC1C|nr:leucine-rich repeat domain-containing protein [Faecalibacterium sp. DFI.5.82]MDE8689786.1 leucine-rich repeat protein [Faecalibacterium sp. DFI.5.82]